MNSQALTDCQISTKADFALSNRDTGVKQAVLSVFSRVKHAKLMMVDDEPVILKVIEKYLRVNGYSNFVKTTNATDTIGMIHREQPDLVLMDIMMPQISGLELLRQIRCNPLWQCLPVIILTAHCDPATRSEALSAGCTDFLTKPFDPCELALRVRNTLIAKESYDQVVRHASQLEANIRRQTEALIAAQHSAELRYHAGKAEIATDILHNVGNALNSVNVGVNLVAHTIHNSRLSSLQKATDLLREHESNLARYLTQDRRGQVLPSYLCEVTDALLKEREKVVRELELLAKHVQHINSIVATQQKYAKTCDIAEEVSLPQLLNDIDELLSGSFVRHNINVVRHYENMPPVWTDRQRLLQVLLNVVKNAVDSINAANQAGLGQLEIHLGNHSEERAFVLVKDNGVGIPPENMSKLFVHGFTTKQHGHGFGLHSCANIIQELGGSIQALSDGAGKGATFRLEVPFKHKEN